LKQSSKPTSPGAHGRALRALRLLLGLGLALLTISQLGELAASMSARLSEPLVHDRLGGSIVDHVIRVRQGQPLYIEPTDRWVPLVYTPLYYYFAALIMGGVGEGEFACRLSSILLIGASAVVALSLVKRMTRSWAWTALGVPLVVAGYSLCEYFYDSPRVDPMSTLFVLLATWVAVCGRGRGGALLLGVLCTGAYFSKQSTLAYTVVLLSGILLLDWRRGALASLTFLGLGGSLLALANGSSDGWFWRYGVFLPTQHSFPADRVRTILTGDFLATGLPLAGLLTAMAVLLKTRVQDEERRSTLVLAIAALATAAFSFTSHARSGATFKVLMPLGPIFAAALPVVFAWLARTRATAHGRRAVQCLALLLTGAFLVQHKLVAADATLPTADLERWEALQADVRERCELGQVWVAPWGYFTTPIEGQGMRPNLIALEDYLGVKGNDTGLPFPQALKEMIQEQQFATIYLPMKGGNRPLRDLLRRHYKVVEKREMVVGTKRFTMALGTFVPNGEPTRRRP